MPSLGEVGEAGEELRYGGGTAHKGKTVIGLERISKGCLEASHRLLSGAHGHLLSPEESLQHGPQRASHSVPQRAVPCHYQDSSRDRALYFA